MPRPVMAKVKERLSLFIQDEFAPILNNHPLQGGMKGYRSINITSNIRAIYKRINSEIRLFSVLDSHSNLYK